MVVVLEGNNRDVVAMLVRSRQCRKRQKCDGGVDGGEVVQGRQWK